MKLWHKVMIGLFSGALAGYVLSKEGLAMMENGDVFLTTYVKPVGTLFINMIKMVIVPLIFFALVSGITSMTDNESFKRVGLKSVVAYMLTCTFAVLIGLAFGHFVKPGEGVDLKGLAESGSISPFVANTNQQINSAFDIILHMVPTNIFNAMATDQILQVVVFAIFTGIVLNSLGTKGKNLVEFCHSAAALVFRMIEIIIKFSPYGVFALIAWAVGTQGFAILKALAIFAGTVASAMVVQYLLFGVMLVVFGRLSPLPFYKKVLETQSIAFSTSSSKATLSTAMRVANERMGVSRSSTSFVLPLGAAINMDGTAIYLGICALFFAQAFGHVLAPHDYVMIIITSTLASIGAAGIPSGSLMMMGLVLTSVGLPLEGIGIIAAIDRILDMLRTTVNITGDTLITVLVDKSEGTFDEKAYYNDKL